MTPSSCPIRDHQQRTPLDTDIAQVIPLTLVADFGHRILGSIDLASARLAAGRLVTWDRHRQLFFGARAGEGIALHARDDTDLGGRQARAVVTP
jgi:hypothetical protein